MQALAALAAWRHGRSEPDAKIDVYIDGTWRLTTTLASRTWLSDMQVLASDIVCVLPCTAAVIAFAILWALVPGRLAQCDGAGFGALGRGTR